MGTGGLVCEPGRGSVGQVIYRMGGEGVIKGCNIGTCLISGLVELSDAFNGGGWWTVVGSEVGGSVDLRICVQDGI